MVKNTCEFVVSILFQASCPIIDTMNISNITSFEQAVGCVLRLWSVRDIGRLDEKNITRLAYSIRGV